MRITPAAAFLLLAAASCSKEPPKPGAPVTFDSFCSAAWNPTDEQGLSVHKRVSIEGYVALQKVLTLCSDTCQIHLSEQPGGKGRTVSASFKVGDGENQLEKLPETYTAKDLKVHARDGKLIDPSKKVKLTGGRGGEDPGCYLAVDLVEPL